MSKKVLIILAVCCVVSLGVGTGLGMLIVSNRAEVAVEIAAPPAPLAPAPDPEQAKEAWRQAIGGNQLKSEYEEYEKQWAEQDARREREAAAKAAKEAGKTE